MSPAGAWMAGETGSKQIRDFFRPPFLKISGKEQNRFLALIAFWRPSTAPC